MDCIVKYKGKEYSQAEFITMLHDGLLDTLIADKTIDNSNFKQGGTNAVQELSTDEVLQRQQEEVGEAGSGRSRVEQGEQGNEASQKSKTKPEGVQKNDEKALSETSLKNEEVAKKRKEYGFAPRELPSRKSNEALFEEADRTLEKGYDIQSLMDDIIFDKKTTSDVEQVILLRYQALKEAELIRANKNIEDAVEAKNDTLLRKYEAERNAILDDLQKSYQASEQSGTELGRALRSRQLLVMQDYSLANMFIQKRKANGDKKLSNEQIAEVQKQYDEISQLNEELTKKVADLEEKNRKLEANKALARLNRENQRQRRASTREQILDSRKKAVDSIFEIAKKQRANLSANPIPIEMIKPLAQLAKTYVQEGVLTIEELVDKIHADIKDAFEDLSKRDVRDALSGYGRENELTKDEIKDRLFDLRQQARLISKIEDLEKGIKAYKEGSERRRVASEELEALRERVRQLSEQDEALSDFKKRTQNSIDEYERRIREKDFISQKEKREIQFDEEALELRDKLNKAKFDYEVSILKDKLANRSKFQKAADVVTDVISVPRSIMSSFDFSAPFRQGLILTVANPKIAYKAFGEMFTQAFDAKKHERWLNDLKASPMFQIMKDSGLYIADERNPKLTAREEQFMSNIAERIPIIGRTLEFKIKGKKFALPGMDLIGGSQRAYTAYLNKLRADVFMQGADQFYANGNTLENSPQLFEALGDYINTATGRGSLGKFEDSAGVLSALFFSPRLLASRFRLLTNPINPSWWNSVPKEVKKMYFADMAKTIAFGASLLGLAAYGWKDDDEVKVETDPRSSDFGKLRIKNVRYDIWGGMQQFVRTGGQLISGETKSTNTGVIRKLDGKSFPYTTRLGQGMNFLRSKLSPVPSFFVNALDGKNVVGQEFSIQNDLPQLFFPLAASDIGKDIMDGEPQKFFTKGVPSIFGVGVQEYEPQKKKGNER